MMTIIRRNFFWSRLKNSTLSEKLRRTAFYERYQKFKNVEEGWKRTRGIIISSGVCTATFAWQISYYACMPDRPKLTLPDDLENWRWSQDQIMNFTREEFAEWDHQTNGLGQFISFFPNRYREMTAMARMGWFYEPGALQRRWLYIQKWFDDLVQPEYNFFLPETGPNSIFGPNQITVSFELLALMEEEYDYDHGWRFRFRKGAKYFLTKLSQFENVELVLYTSTDYHQWEPIARHLASKTNGLLYLGEDCQKFTKRGVNWKLFKNSCHYDGGSYAKSLQQMNREMSRLIHLDLSRDLFGSSLNTANCVFLHRDENDQNLNDITNNLIDLIRKTEEHTDVRDLLSKL